MFEILSIIFLALMAEIMDSGIGMMYGTLLCLLLISAGYDPLLVVPSVLISQALGGAIATVRHHKYRNAYFEGLSKDDIDLDDIFLDESCELLRECCEFLST